MQKKVSQVSLPNSLVRDPNIKPLEFCILLRFKYMTFLQKTLDLEVDINKLKTTLNVADRRTIKTALSNLTTQGYINEVEYKNRQPSLIQINKKKLTPGNFFTQLPTALIKKVESIGYTGIRLLYYYESYINRSKALNQFAYPGFMRICDDTNIDKGTLDKYNDILVKEKLLKIQKHNPEYIYENAEAEKGTIHTYNNHYDVRLENILKL